ncbi:MAG: hypothetical protein ABJB74_11230 [Gemmatimonas sp.]
MLFSRRLHGTELLDIPRCPRVIRDGATDYLQFIIRTGNAYGPIVPMLASALAERGITNVIDLCSGAGGPWPELRQLLVNAGAPANLRVTLTDLYPNLNAFTKNQACDPLVTGDSVPLDIEQHVMHRPGLRTLFSSFHHFAPTTAERVLRNVLHTNQPILIAEVTQRSVWPVAFMLLAPLLVWLATPRIRPFSWSRIFFTYVIPVIPFVVCYDGIVSCCRTYSPDDLKALVRSVDDLRYEWRLGLVRGRGPLPVTFALGLPTSRES